jgi:hypothetical protein
MMEGDMEGNGPLHLDFNLGDEAQHFLGKLLTPQAFTQAFDVDSGMGWHPGLGAINVNICIYDPPLSSRNIEKKHPPFPSR